MSSVRPLCILHVDVFCPEVSDDNIRIVSFREAATAAIHSWGADKQRSFRQQPRGSQLLQHIKIFKSRYFALVLFIPVFIPALRHSSADLWIQLMFMCWKME